MSWNTPEVILLATSSIVSLILIIYGFRHKDAPGALPFAALMICALVWSFGYILEITDKELTVKVFWLNVQQIGIYGSSIVWLILALQFSGHVRWLKKKVLIPLSILPALAILFIWTNDIHHLMQLDVYLETAGQLSFVKTVKTPLSLIFIIYSYFLLVLSLYFLIKSALRTLSPYREQRIIFTVSLLLPMATTVMELVGLNPFAPFRPTPITFIISGFLIVWSFGRYQLFHIWPIARDKLIDELQNGVIVTDTAGRITDLNPAARTILKQILDGDAPKDAIDYSLALFTTSWPGWYKSYTEQKEHQVIEISLPEDIYYEVRISLLKSPRGLLIGHLTVIHDITQAKQTEKELFQQATTDYLTGIYNRRHFMELCEREYLISVRYQKPLSLMMIDIDFFKQVNDTYGHNGGDQILKQFPVVCGSMLRVADLFGRMGGEEFAVMLPETSSEGASIAAEKMRRTVEQASFQIDDQIVSLTISIGVVTQEVTDSSFETILHRADELLYKAKEIRNCVIQE